MAYVKDKAEKVLKKAALRLAMPYILWALGAVFGVLCIIGLVIMVVTTLCNTWAGWGVSKVSGAVGAGDYCKAFQAFQPIAEKLKNAQVQPIDYSKTPTQ